MLVRDSFHRIISGSTAISLATAAFLFALPVQAQSLSDFGDCLALGPIDGCATVSGSGVTAGVSSGSHGVSAEAGTNFSYAPAGTPASPLSESLGGTNAQGNFDGVAVSGR